MTVDSPIWTPARHPLARLLRDIAAGAHHQRDGAWTRVSPWSQQVQGILSFTGHSIMAVSYDITDDTLTDLGVDGFNGAHQPTVMAALAGANGWVDSLDVLLLGVGAGSDNGQTLVSRPDLAKEPLVEHSRRVRQNLQVMGSPDADDQDLVVLSHGVAGLREIRFALDSRKRGKGQAVGLVRHALRRIPENELVVASVPPGNAAALRSVLRAGFTPVGSIQLFSNRPERRV